MEEIDFEDNVVIQEAQVIQEAVLVNNHINLVTQSLGSLSVSEHPRQDGWNLYIAARDGQASSLGRILEQEQRDNNENIDLINKSFVDGEQRCTPLIIAARNGHSRVVSALIENEMGDYR